MVSKIFLACGVALLQVQSVLAVPAPAKFPKMILPRGNLTVDPPANPTPIVSEITMTEQELEQYIEEIQHSEGKRSSSAQSLASRQAGSGTDGALLTFIEGETLPGTNASGCQDFVINGPFTSLHFIMGSSNVRHISATSFGGETTDIGNTDPIVDAGEFKFADNERITRFSIGRMGGINTVSSFTFETDAGNSYEALSGLIKDGTNPAEYEDLTVGSGILARIRGTYCDIGIMGSFGVDFLDELDSISISDIDYSGFTDNIMPTGAGTQMSVGSQILDNRNSSEKQTITLTTTDAITRQTTITTQVRAQVGGSVSVEAGAGIPFLAEGKVTTEANWQIEALTVSSPYGPFVCLCLGGKDTCH